MNKQLLALYGLQWTPFSPEPPPEALRLTPAVENFAWRIEHALVREGGFALISGDVGTGKSVALRLIAERLAPVPDLTVAALTHPSANLADFYRELGDLFAVELRPHNRWLNEAASRQEQDEKNETPKPGNFSGTPRPGCASPKEKRHGFIGANPF